MKKIFSSYSLKLNIFNISTSIIYNDEKSRLKMLEELPLDDYLYIDSKVVKYNILVKQYLQVNEFSTKMVPYFKLETLMAKKMRDLTMENLIYLKIIVSLFNASGIIIFDDALTFLSDEKKKIIINYIKENKLMFINITSDVEETLFADYLIALGKDSVAIEGPTKEVLKEEKLLKRLGFNLPFALDLSLQLKSYGILNKEYFDIDKLVKDLWA